MPRYSVYDNKNNTTYKFRFINKSNISFQKPIEDTTETYPELTGMPYSLYTNNKNYMAINDSYIISDITGKISVKIFDEKNNRFLSEEESIRLFDLRYKTVETEESLFYTYEDYSFNIYIEKSGTILLKDKNNNTVDKIDIIYSTYTSRLQPLFRSYPIGIVDKRRNGVNICRAVWFDWEELTYNQKYLDCQVNFQIYNCQNDYMMLSVCDSKGNVQEAKIINANKLDINIWTLGETIKNIATDLITGNLATLKSKTISEVTDITINVPNGGYFYIEDAKTNNIVKILNYITLLMYGIQTVNGITDMAKMKTNIDKLDCDKLVEEIIKNEITLTKFVEKVDSHLSVGISNDKVVGDKLFQKFSDMMTAVIEDEEMLEFFIELIISTADDSGEAVLKGAVEKCLLLDKTQVPIKLSQNIDNIINLIRNIVYASSDRGFEYLYLISVPIK